MKSLLYSLKLDRVIKATSTIRTNTALVALVLVCLTAMFAVVIFRLSGVLLWVFGGAIFTAFLVFAFRRTHYPPSIPNPAGQAYLIELLKYGVIYGDSGKLISIQNILGLPSTQKPPKSLPPANQSENHKDALEKNQE